MWTIQLYDGRPGILYLRDGLLEGRILAFEHEEGALRFMGRIAGKVEAALNVRLRPVRYSDDPRKDKPYKVPEKAADMLADFLLGML